METTLFFTGLLGIWFFVLSLRTIFGRRDNRVSLGTGQSDDLLRRVRMHGNFAEYIPFLLIIMMLLELQGVSQWLLLTYGGLILVGRGLHAYGLWSPKTPMWARIWGMQLTLWPLFGGCVGLLVIYFF